jgi:hypothetical protein
VESAEGTNHGFRGIKPEAIKPRSSKSGARRRSVIPGISYMLNQSGSEPKKIEHFRPIVFQHHGGSGQIR